MEAVAEAMVERPAAEPASRQPGDRAVLAALVADFPANVQVQPMAGEGRPLAGGTPDLAQAALRPDLQRLQQRADLAGRQEGAPSAVPGALPAEGLAASMVAD